MVSLPQFDPSSGKITKESPVKQGADIRINPLSGEMIRAIVLEISNSKLIVYYQEADPTAYPLQATRKNTMVKETVSIGKIESVEMKDGTRLNLNLGWFWKALGLLVCVGSLVGIYASDSTSSSMGPSFLTY